MTTKVLLARASTLVPTSHYQLSLRLAAQHNTMRRAIPRITRSVTTRPCCHPTTPATTPRRFATAIPKKADLPLQEILRRKIWGTDEAPGAPGMLPPALPVPVVEEPTKEEGYIEEGDGRTLPVVGLVPGLTEWDVPTYVHISLSFPLSFFLPYYDVWMG